MILGPVTVAGSIPGSRRARFGHALRQTVAVTETRRRVMAGDIEWPKVDGIAYGGDYSPEQWPREIWHEDVAHKA